MNTKQAYFFCAALSCLFVSAGQANAQDVKSVSAAQKSKVTVANKAGKASKTAATAKAAKKTALKPSAVKPGAVKPSAVQVAAKTSVQPVVLAAAPMALPMQSSNPYLPNRAANPYLANVSPQQPAFVIESTGMGKKISFGTLHLYMNPNQKPILAVSLPCNTVGKVMGNFPPYAMGEQMMFGMSGNLNAANLLPVQIEPVCV